MRIHEEEAQFRFYESIHIKAKSLYKRLVSLGPNGHDILRRCSVAKCGEIRLFGHLCSFSGGIRVTKVPLFLKHFAYPFIGTLLSGYIPEHAVAGRACSIFRGLVGCTTRAVFV